MAELLESSKIFYTPYEPKLKNRFIMEIGGIPAFTIKTAQRPQITFEKVELEHMNITEKQFFDKIDEYRLPHLWEKQKGKWKLKHAVWHEEN